MIKTVRLHNFQKHKDLSLFFNQGVNIIYGESNSGKTAIVRALNWLRQATPSGEDYLRNKSKDKIISVEVETENGFVKIERDFSKKKNSLSYSTITNSGEKKYDFFGKSIPEDVFNILELKDINFQFQFDSDFCLSLTPGQIANLFSEIINVKEADSFLEFSSKELSKLSSSILSLSSDVEKNTILLGRFDGIDNFLPMIEELERKEKLLDIKNKSFFSFSSLISEHFTITKKLDFDFDSLEKQIDFLSSKKEILANKEKELKQTQEILSVLDEISICNSGIQALNCLDMITDDLNRISLKSQMLCSKENLLITIIERRKIPDFDISEMQESLNTISTKKESLKEKKTLLVLISDYFSCIKNMMLTEASLKEFKVCPTCGKLLENN